MRTQEEIKAQVLFAFQSNVVLNTLDLNLPMSVEGALVDTVSYILWLFEALIYKKIEDIQAEADKAEQYVAPWYIEYTKAFQLGDTLNWDTITKRYRYSTITPANQIVKYAAINPTAAGGVLIKVAKDANGTPVKLTTVELSAVQGYWDTLKPVGTFLTVRSADPDKIKVVLNVKYDPYYPSTQISLQVEAVIKNYIKRLDFGGIMRVSRLIDAVQGVTGVVDVWVDQAQCKTSTGAYATIGNDYIAYAGYMELDLSGSTINYLV